jgi:hypothetical protein
VNGFWSPAVPMSRLCTEVSHRSVPQVQCPALGSVQRKKPQSSAGFTTTMLQHDPSVQSRRCLICHLTSASAHYPPFHYHRTGCRPSVPCGIHIQHRLFFAFTYCTRRYCAPFPLRLQPVPVLHTPSKKGPFPPNSPQNTTRPSPRPITR